MKKERMNKRTKKERMKICVFLTQGKSYMVLLLYEYIQIRAYICVLLFFLFFYCDLRTYCISLNGMFYSQLGQNVVFFIFWTNSSQILR